MFYNFYSKKMVIKVNFGDHLDVRNDFLYNAEYGKSTPLIFQKRNY